jgi:hypothetical protein
MNLLKDLTGLGSHDKNMENWFITVERAEGVEDKDKWSKTDTYVAVEFGGKNVKTHTINNSRTPFWNETFDLKLEPDHIKDLHIKLMDDDFGKDDPIGSAVVSKGDLPLRSGDERYFRVPVFRKEQTTGVVVVRIKKITGSDLSSSHAPLNQSQTYQQQSQYQQQPYNQSQGISSGTYQTQYPSSNYSYQGQSTTHPHEQHHPNQQPFIQPSQQQPYMGGGNVQTNYEDQYQKRY